MSSSSGFDVEPTRLREVASSIDSTGSVLFAAAGATETAPDAGRSTDEVFKALGSLAAAAAGLAQDIGAISVSTGATSADFSATDQGVAGATPSQPSGPVQP